MQTFETTDPATGEVLAEVPISDAESIRQAVERARAAGERWAAVPYEARGAALLAAAERLAEREQELADLVTREMGKPRAEALGEIRGRARGMERLVDEVGRAIAPERVEGQNVQSVILREPLGVVAAITPWNFPVGMPCSILLPALLTGNAVVFKPSEHVPLVGAALAEILSTFLPDGVLELVQGPGEVGAQLVDSDVQMIGFVGSRDTGVRIMRAAAGGLKRLVLELGGKDPLLVFADADLEAAAECAVRHSLRNAGQVCCSIERVYVAEEVADAFEAKVLELARGWRPGNGFDPETRLGPMVSGAQRDKVAAQVGDAVARGGRLLHGGAAVEGPGYFFESTVVADVPEDSTLATEETFGPVVSISRFDGSEQSAIELANRGIYGLGANVYTGDVERGVRVARGIRSGQVGVNRYLSAAGPWVGARQSGFGFLGGPDGHRQFTVPKTISIQQG
jgi:acyl-CoA reductase-like NAD-dependent aldehyde dehydrogenase